MTDPTSPRSTSAAPAPAAITDESAYRLGYVSREMHDNTLNAIRNILAPEWEEARREVFESGNQGFSMVVSAAVQSLREKAEAATCKDSLQVAPAPAGTPPDVQARFHKAARSAFRGVVLAGREADPTPAADIIAEAFAPLVSELTAALADKERAEKARRWRDPKVELPEIGVRVLVCQPRYVGVSIATVSPCDGRLWWINDNHRCDTPVDEYAVTRWVYPPDASTPQADAAPPSDPGGFLRDAIDIINAARDGKDIARSPEQAELAREAVKACSNRPPRDEEWARRFAKDIASLPD
jgi:hypothetical protein